MNSIQIVHTDQTHAQKSGTIEATAGSVSFENCLFGKSKYDKATAIHVSQKTVSLQLVSCNFTEINTTIDDITTEDYDGGAVYIERAQSVRITGGLFQRNQGYRTGAIRTSRVDNKTVTITGVQFDRNQALKATLNLEFILGNDIGNDIVFDHEFELTDITPTIGGSSSSLSQYPSIGSIKDAYKHGTLDYLLGRVAPDILYVNQSGTDDILAGSQGSPFRTIAYAVQTAPTSRDQGTTLSLADGSYSEKS
ncbi:MAG: hypothetical protein EZS28_053487, partial [Streblomastix strix]